jgi:succinate dehydrogenase / fumarate reductase cytochrome b subunit
MASSPTVVGKAKSKSLLWTAIGKKLVMAITGLALVGFLVLHLAGNLLLLQGGGWFNTYATVLNGIPFLLIVELGLGAIFLIHAFDGYTLWKGNKEARGQEYHYKDWTKHKKSKKSKKSIASTTMMVTGIILLTFTVMHVWHFKYHHSIGPANPISEMKSGEASPGIGVAGVGSAAPESQSAAETKKETLQLAEHVAYEFKKPYVLAIYVLCMIAVTLHLYHAIGSSLQTLGAGATRIGQGLWYFGRAVAVVVGTTFTLLPIWVFFFYKMPVPEPAQPSAQSAQSQVLAPASSSSNSSDTQ